MRVRQEHWGGLRHREPNNEGMRDAFSVLLTLKRYYSPIRFVDILSDVVFRRLPYDSVLATTKRLRGYSILSLRFRKHKSWQGNRPELSHEFTSRRHSYAVGAERGGTHAGTKFRVAGVFQLAAQT